MKFDLRWLNCFWLLIPLLIWNITLGHRIANEKVISDAYSSRGLLILENITRVAVFALPLFIPLRWEAPLSQVGIAVYLAGTILYFASWIPLLLFSNSSWSMSPVGLLAPRLTPLLPFLGIAMIGSSWFYGSISLLFVILHVWHGIQNL